MHDRGTRQTEHRGRVGHDKGLAKRFSKSLVTPAVLVGPRGAPRPVGALGQVSPDVGLTLLARTETEGRAFDVGLNTPESGRVDSCHRYILVLTVGTCTRPRRFGVKSVLM